jgi:glycosyltransferase involved in cell wall biosynthesis
MASQSTDLRSRAARAQAPNGVRLLGIDNEDLPDMSMLRDFRTQSSRNSGLYRALDQRLHVVGTFNPQLPLWHKRLLQLIHISPGRDRWRRRTGLSPMSFRARTKIVERELRARAGTFDVALELYCLFAPGRTPKADCYAMYLDATMALTRRHFPAGAPIGPLAEKRWLALERRTYREAARLFPMSDWVRSSLIEDYGVDPARIVVAGAGTDVTGDLRSERRWDRRIALFVGLDWKRKGGPVLLRAWRRVRRELPDAQLWIVGTRRAYGPHGREGVHWWGRMPHEDVARLYREASVFVLASLFDPFPVVVREAMGHGLPCVATNTGGTAEMIRKPEEGRLVPAGDADALAEALLELLGDPARAETMGRAAHAHTVAEVSWDRVADRMVPHLQALARG